VLVARGHPGGRAGAPGPVGWLKHPDLRGGGLHGAQVAARSSRKDTLATMPRPPHVFEAITTVGCEATGTRSGAREVAEQWAMEVRVRSHLRRRSIDGPLHDRYTAATRVGHHNAGTTR
jgi:hypothetical protein